MVRVAGAGGSYTAPATSDEPREGLKRQDERQRWPPVHQPASPSGCDPAATFIASVTKRDLATASSASAAAGRARRGQQSAEPPDDEIRQAGTRHVRAAGAGARPRPGMERRTRARSGHASQRTDDDTRRARALQSSSYYGALLTAQ